MIVDLLAWNKLPSTLIVEEEAVEKNKEQCVNYCDRHWQSRPAQRQWYSLYRKLGSIPEVTVQPLKEKLLTPQWWRLDSPYSLFQVPSRAWLKSAVFITGLTEFTGALTQSASHMLRILNTVTHFVHNPQGHTRNSQAFLQEEKSNGTFHCPVENPSRFQGWNVTESPPF